VLRAGISSLSVVRYATLLAVASLGGCSLLAPDIAPVEDPVVVVPAEPPPKPAIKPQPPEPPPEPPSLPPVAVVLSSSQPVFLDVANALAEHLDECRVFDLSDSSQPQDHNLLNPNSRGVAPLAPLDAQLAAWTESDPTISRIGIIVGEGHDALIEEAQLAAQKHKVELRTRVATSDQETLYLFRRMVQDIDGFWLFPDNRVLSSRSLQEILQTARRNQVAVAVPSESMLDMGASISLATEAEDIAATIAGIIRKIQSDGLQSVRPVTPLSAIRVVTRDSEKVVKR